MMTLCKFDVLRCYGYCSFSFLSIYFSLSLSRVISLHVLKLISPSSVCPFCLKQYSVFRCLLSPSPPTLNSFAFIVNLLLKLFQFPLSCVSFKRSLFLLSCTVLDGLHPYYYYYTIWMSLVTGLFCLVLLLNQR